MMRAHIPDDPNDQPRELSPEQHDGGRVTEIRPLPDDSPFCEMPDSEFTADVIMEREIDDLFDLSEQLDNLIEDWVDNWVHWADNPGEYAEWRDWVARYGNPDAEPDDPDYPGGPPIVTA